MNIGLQLRTRVTTLAVVCWVLSFLHDRSPFLHAEQTEIPNINGVFTLSYQQVSPRALAVWDSVFSCRHVDRNPIGMLLLIIAHFSRFDRLAPEQLLSLEEIIAHEKTNKLSSTAATAALMQRLGWDVQVFCNSDECYLGLCLSDDWWVRKGTWIEKDGRRYYLKEFDDKTPVGELVSDDPRSTYASPQSRGANLQPFPVCEDLPRFGGGKIRKLRLAWDCEGTAYAITALIPDELLEWTRNLPPSLYGAARCGVQELAAIGIADTLKALTRDLGEYDRVNFLYKFCQSKQIFTYDSGLPIRSIARQFMDKKNDCDGRSVLLYSLLKAVLGYADEDIVFVSWPNHLALALRPKTDEARKILSTDGSLVSGGYYILDAAYAGNTHWGDRMMNLPDACGIID
ncbi:MAG TPA: hypothetical protein VF399_11715 [bacterium]